MADKNGATPLKCFVAMALKHEDTDTVYDELICPTLKTQNVIPRRVDRLEHNEDIDDQIIRELDDCDFAIADLTYARPSVYFEAGYAQQRVPVIYICRDDHFKPQKDDKYGNFRVHFDLQMKNIISWASTSDRTFCEKLANRVAYVAGPLRQDKEEAAGFAALSAKERTARTLSICKELLNAEGYRFACSGKADELDSALENLPWEDHKEAQKRFGRITRRLSAISPGWASTRCVSDTLHAALVHVAGSLTKRLLNDVRCNLVMCPVYNLNPLHKMSMIHRIEESILLCAFDKLDADMFGEVFYEFRQAPESRTWGWTGTEAFPRGDSILEAEEVYLSRTAEKVMQLFAGRRHDRT